MRQTGKKPKKKNLNVFCLQIHSAAKHSVMLIQTSRCEMLFMSQTRCRVNRHFQQAGNSGVFSTFTSEERKKGCFFFLFSNKAPTD